MIARRRRAAVSLAIAAFFACAEPGAEMQIEAPTNAAREPRDTAPGDSATEGDYIISQSGVGRILLGMTLAEVRRALPSATVARATDGEGAALVEVTLAPGQALMLWADEDDADGAIDWAKSVRVIETFSPAFRTREGVHPGISVRDAEAIYGAIRQIELSEIESRQYIAFERQPAYLTLRLDYTGIFRGGARTTREFEPDAKIMSLAVSSY